MVSVIKCTQSVLEEAIENNGTTISDFRGLMTNRKFQQFQKVYNKKEQPCPDWGIPIQRIVSSKEALFFVLNVSIN
ncbi:MAG: hypothetical protein CM1200mP30_34330 [Pseudomonadota bacterium]|nr:MAG: hypothetical protein CM1200mP30_34330 [Pseudomonadota bacterium]